MGIINQLDYATANLVAAGEVIERPASVCKELIENSIDAGATKIVLEIKRGGVELIRVTDDGKGMERDDVPICIKRHATSKLRCGEDLNTIMTLGFRGEALASVAAVSRLRIRTKRRCDEYGTEMLVEYDGTPVVTESAMADGTTILVEELFANVPARRKFLKKDQTEALTVLAMAEKIAMSVPHIKMQVIIDGTVKFHTAGTGKLADTLYALYGSEFASKLIEVERAPTPDYYWTKGLSIHVHGFVGTPDNFRTNRNYQNFFINGRYVRSKCLQAALEQACLSYVPTERFPVCVLFVDMPPEIVDVNVHPTKLEVKFANEKAIFETVYSAIRGALETKIPRPEIRLEDCMTREEAAVRRAEFLKKRAERDALNAFLPEESFEEKSEPKPKPVYNNQKNVKVGQLSISDVPPAEPAPGPPEPLPPAGEIVSELVRAAPVPPENVEIIQQNYFEGIPPLLARAMRAKDNAPAKPQKMVLGELPKEFNDAVMRPREKCIKPGKRPSQMTEEEMNEWRISVGLPPRPLTKPEPEPAPDPAPEFRLIGEAFHSYVFVEVADRVMVVDKHAAHERILFEELRAGMRARMASSDVPSQMMLVPYEVPLTPEEMSAIDNYADEVRALGFEFTRRDDHTLSVTAIPPILEASAIADVLITIADNVRQGFGTPTTVQSEIFERALYQASCKAAIKIGRIEEPEHIKWIVSKLLSLDDIKVCPHGRPVAFDLTKSAIERQFKRV